MDQTPSHHTGSPRSQELTKRESSYLDYLRFLKDGLYISEASPIAFGACKMARYLDEVAKLASKQGKLNLKSKEKALLRCALFELYFMDHSPRYAVGQEMGNIAKKYCVSNFSRFLNALLRNLPETPPVFSSMALNYSYPDALVKELFSLYTTKEVESILQLGNLPGKSFVRNRPGFEMTPVLPEEIGLVSQKADFYIMNPTPAHLIKTLSSKIPTPKTILDLCASPGGKLLALHDLFPQAELYANEINPHRMERLNENIQKYGLTVDVREGSGESYPEEKKFDLVVLDVPCSNTGVMAKHPEARWRESNLETIQKDLLDKAKKLVSPGGHIIYMTCSLLKRETPHGDPSLIFETQIMPTVEGHDGGYGALLKA